MRHISPAAPTPAPTATPTPPGAGRLLALRATHHPEGDRLLALQISEAQLQARVAGRQMLDAWLKLRGCARASSCAGDGARSSRPASERTSESPTSCISSPDVRRPRPTPSQTLRSKSTGART